MGMLEEIYIRIKKIRKDLKTFFSWLQSVLNTIVDENANPPIVEDSKGLLDFLNLLFGNTQNILDVYFADFNIENPESQNSENDLLNDENNKNKTSGNFKPPETLFDLMEKVDLKYMTNLSSKLENWEDFIYQKENEGSSNNTTNFGSQYSNFDTYMDIDDSINNKDTGNSSFNIFSEENNILNENSFYNNKKKLFDEGIQNSPKKQCISMDDEDNILFKFNNNVNDDINLIFNDKVNILSYIIIIIKA